MQQDDGRPGTPGSWASSAGTRRSMQGNRRRDTSPEWRVRRLLHARGLRYRVDQPLPFDRRRRADITFTRAKVVVFIDGCFWHGCPQHYVEPRSHQEYWIPKVEANRRRDEETSRRLASDGWTVLRFWEHEDPDAVAERVAAVVADRLRQDRDEPAQPSPEPPAALPRPPEQPDPGAPPDPDDQALSGVGGALGGIIATAVLAPWRWLRSLPGPHQRWGC